VLRRDYAEQRNGHHVPEGVHAQYADHSNLLQVSTIGLTLG
jgi:hypothetical protein